MYEIFYNCNWISVANRRVTYFCILAYRELFITCKSSGSHMCFSIDICLRPLETVNCFIYTVNYCSLVLILFHRKASNIHIAVVKKVI